MLEDSTKVASSVKEQYVASLKCLTGSLLALTREQQLLLSILLFLHVFAPLGLLAFEEARTVLLYAVIQYCIMHALMHFTSQLIHSSPFHRLRLS